MIKAAIAGLLLVATGVAAQQRQHDPLNNLEIDKIRDAAQKPEVRLKLYVEFARERLDSLQKAEQDAKATDRDTRMHDALQDFVDIYDELDDNVDTFADRGEDIRKAIRPVVEADTEFGSKLRAFKAQLEHSSKQSEEFDFLLGTALDAVDDGAKDHRDLLAEQEAMFKNKKEKRHKERSGGG
jgi:hypothetical protein